MMLKRLTLPFVCLLLVLGWTGAASAKRYLVSQGSGAQLQIGGGLPLPIQLTDADGNDVADWGGPIFPPLLIPAIPNKTVMGTTGLGSQGRISIAGPILSHPAELKTIGVFEQNPGLYAVATNLGYQWPASPVVLSTGVRPGDATNTTYFPPGVGLNAQIAYSNTNHKFGGPGRFSVLPNPTPGGIMPGGNMTTNGATSVGVAVTIYGIAVPGPGNPPCTHNALTPFPFPGPGSPACVAGIGQAVPAPFAGGTVSALLTTPGGTPNALMTTMKLNLASTATETNGPGPKPGVGIGKFGATPAGNVTFFTFTPGMVTTGISNSTNPATATFMRLRGFTNMATSRAFPLTTGMLTISQPNAHGAPEVFTLTGGNWRNATGVGAIQLVGGALSDRTLSGPNANRAWVRLGLISLEPVPALPSWGPIVMAGALLAMGALFLVMRRRSRKASA